jgi:peptidyl-prolyl cis-trans isomerase B (cyclophilin B)
MVMAQVAVITTDKGVIKAKFAYDVAPHTIDNFTSLARQNYYDGSAFHRIISGFMIQGGDAYANMPGQAGMGGPGYEIMKEFSEKKHVRGVLSMARSSDPNSAGSQFFIMHGANANLDGSYTAFGDVLEGMDIVDAIAKTPVSDNNGTVRGPMPKILSIKIVPATAENYGLKK